MTFPFHLFYGMYCLEQSMSVSLIIAVISWWLTNAQLNWNSWLICCPVGKHSVGQTFDFRAGTSAPRQARVYASMVCVCMHKETGNRREGYNLFNKTIQLAFIARFIAQTVKVRFWASKCTFSPSQMMSNHKVLLKVVMVIKKNVLWTYFAITVLLCIFLKWNTSSQEIKFLKRKYTLLQQFQRKT